MQGQHCKHKTYRNCSLNGPRDNGVKSVLKLTEKEQISILTEKLLVLEVK